MPHIIKNGEKDIGMTGIQFFGRITASISHELKNALAIINENAGLLEDYVFMAEKGSPIAPEKLKSLSEKVLGQIQRSNGILKNMNEFAHSADAPTKQIDVGETLTLIVKLCTRFAQMRNISLDLKLPDHPVLFTTNPFYAENLIFLCLMAGLENFDPDGKENNRSAPDRRLEIAAHMTDHFLAIGFAPLKAPEKMGDAFFKDEQVNMLRDVLKAAGKIDPAAESFILSFPEDINS